MRAGLGGLGLRPAEFWALTPIELAVMLGRDGGGDGRGTQGRPRSLGRLRLAELMRQFPDPPAQEAEHDMAR